MRRESNRLCMWLLCAALLPPGVRADDINSTEWEGVSKAARTNVILAENYLQQGDLSSALEKASRAVSRDSKSPEAHAVLAMVYDRMGKDDKAEANFNRALRLAPEAGAILNAVAVWHCQHGRYAQSLQQFAKAVADPLYKLKMQSLHNAGQCALMAQDIEAAERTYRAILDINPVDSGALEALAVIHLQNGDALRARAFLQRREAAGPASGQMLELAARIEEAAGSADTAAAYRKRLKDEFPETTTPPNPEGPRTP